MVFGCGFIYLIPVTGGADRGLLAPTREMRPSTARRSRPFQVADAVPQRVGGVVVLLDRYPSLPSPPSWYCKKFLDEVGGLCALLSDWSGVAQRPPVDQILLPRVREANRRDTRPPGRGGPPYGRAGP